MKTIADQLKVDNICRPLKHIPAAAREAIADLETATTPQEQRAIITALSDYLQAKIAEANLEI